jgi:hypothetical protein
MFGPPPLHLKIDQNPTLPLEIFSLCGRSFYMDCLLLDSCADESAGAVMIGPVFSLVPFSPVTRLKGGTGFRPSTFLIVRDDSPESILWWPGEFKFVGNDHGCAL